jgi:hypothetical protein
MVDYHDLFEGDEVVEGEYVVEEGFYLAPYITEDSRFY